METVLLAVGKTRTGYVREGVTAYARRIERYARFEVIELPGPKSAGRKAASVLHRKAEARSLEKHFRAGDVVVLLDEAGREFSSREFAEYLEKRRVSSCRRLLFVSGGAYGVAPTITTRADLVLSLSRMTFPHELVRLIFVEQLYRAFTILAGEPYHHA